MDNRLVVWNEWKFIVQSAAELERTQRTGKQMKLADYRNNFLENEPKTLMKWT